MAFKIGDRVRVVNSDRYRGIMLLGSEGVVRSVGTVVGVEVNGLIAVFGHAELKLVLANTKVYEGVVERYHGYGYDWYEVGDAVIGGEDFVGGYEGRRIRLTVEVLD